MNLFNLFKKQQLPSASKSQFTRLKTSYDISYKLMPSFAFNNFETFESIVKENKGKAGKFIYHLMCSKIQKESADVEAGRQYDLHTYTLGEWDLYILEHPNPDDQRNLAGENGVSDKEKLADTIAPYFSCILNKIDSDEKRLYILGKSTSSNKVTLRQVGVDGSNMNLGSHCDSIATLDGFLDLLRSLLKISHNPRSLKQELTIEEAEKVIQRFGSVLAEGHVIGHEGLLHDSQKTIMVAIMMMENALCESAQETMKSGGKVPSKLDQGLNSIRNLKPFILNYGTIEDSDIKRVDYFNSYSSLGDVPEGEKSECMSLVTKYMYDLLSCSDHNPNGFWPSEFGLG